MWMPCPFSRTVAFLNLHPGSCIPFTLFHVITHPLIHDGRYLEGVPCPCDFRSQFSDVCSGTGLSLILFHL